MPERYRRALFRRYESVMPDTWYTAMGDWLFHNKDRLVRGGGHTRFNWEVLDFDRVTPELFAPLAAAIVERADADTLDALRVDPFDLGAVEAHLTLYHHGCWFGWHDDQHAEREADRQTRAVTFAYYLHAQPRMFDGGQLQYLDGTALEPDNNTLVLSNPYQRHRVTQVACWSREALHGRWAISGWLEAAKPFRPWNIIGRERSK